MVTYKDLICNHDQERISLGQGKKILKPTLNIASYIVILYLSSVILANEQICGKIFSPGVKIGHEEKSLAMSTNIFCQQKCIVSLILCQVVLYYFNSAKILAVW